MKANSSLSSEFLTKEVSQYLTRNGRFATNVFWIKAFSLLLLWAFLYAFLIFISPAASVENYLLGVLWGVVSLLIIFNIGHDAVHGVVSSRKSVNKILAYSFNLVGGNNYSWKLKHNVAHHINTNIEGLDFDTDLDPILRLSPKAKYYSYYKWQSYWVLLVYSLLSLLIITIGDVKIFYQVKAAGLVERHPVREWVILLVTKLYYVALVVVVPVLVGGYELRDVLLVFFSFHLLNGLLIAFIFMPSHYFLNSAYYDSKEEAKNWFSHQMSTTMDIAPGNKIAFHVIGGLNLNVPHHLFPNFCHVHYYEIAKIIQRNCLENGMVYHQNSFYYALGSHFKLIKKLGHA